MIHHILPSVPDIRKDFLVVCDQEASQQCTVDLQGHPELLDQVWLVLFWGIAQDHWGCKDVVDWSES